MVRLSKVAPCDEPISLSVVSSSGSEIPSTFSSGASFGSRHRGRVWKERLSSLLSIRSIYISVTLLLIAITAAVLSAFSVVSQQKLVQNTLKDRTSSNAIITSASVSNKMSFAVNLVQSSEWTHTDRSSSAVRRRLIRSDSTSECLQER